MFLGLPGATERSSKSPEWIAWRSPGNRTRLKFMDWVDRDEFIADIKAEVASASDTATRYPSHTPEAGVHGPTPGLP